jgi:hypothetical protein
VSAPVETGDVQTRDSLPAEAYQVAFVDDKYGLLGARSWGQVYGLSGWLRVLEVKGAGSGEKPGELQGKRSTKRDSQIT